jgi:hypothetical protein
MFSNYPMIGWMNEEDSGFFWLVLLEEGQNLEAGDTLQVAEGGGGESLCKSFFSQIRKWICAL